MQFFTITDILGKLHTTNGNDNVISDNNNTFYASSTPKAKILNGHANDSNFNYTKGSLNLSQIDDSSPSKNLTKEQYLNSVNANTTTNGTNTTTIIADIEGEVRKRTRFASDKSYYIAKEILMTELTYKKDLDVINVVSKIYFRFVCQIQTQTNFALISKNTFLCSGLETKSQKKNPTIAPYY